MGASSQGIPILSPDCKIWVQNPNDMVVAAGSVSFAGTRSRVSVPALLFTSS